MKFPSELIYALWSTLVGSRGIIYCPLEFDNAYVHIPESFGRIECQLILIYTIIWTLLVESTKNYTKGQIGFVGLDRRLKFGNTSQTSAVATLLEKYRSEECLNTTISGVLECIRTRDETGWEKDKELRKWLKEKLSELLNEIGYWDKVIVIPVN